MADADRTISSLNPPDGLRASAETYFGPELELAARYAASLASDAVVRGLIGPREADRVWDRHLLNCAAMAPVLPTNAHVIDVGSGAGLPGVVLAIARTDTTVVLLEPLARRTAYLSEVVVALGLDDRVSVVRARAEEVASDPAMFHVKHADVVTARAVAALDRLAGWCLPLAAIGGRVLAMKGASAREEVRAYEAEIARLGGGAPVVREYGSGLLAEPTTVVEIVRERAVVGGRQGRSSRRTSRRARG